MAWDSASLSFRCTNRPPLPSTEEALAITVCGGLELQKLTVKAAYQFLLRRAIEEEAAEIPLISLRAGYLWPKRWKWLATSGLPMHVRQMVWRRWHGKLYFGETNENPQPSCPFCDEPSSALHLKACRVGTEALNFFQRCWKLWTEVRFPDNGAHVPEAMCKCTHGRRRILAVNIIGYLF